MLRERTKIELLKKGQKLRINDTQAGVKPLEFINIPAPHNEVLCRRLEYALNECLVGNDTLYGEISKSVVAQASLNENGVFHNNCRDYLHNMLTLMGQLYYRARQLGHIESGIDQDTLKLSRQVFVLIL